MLQVIYSFVRFADAGVWSPAAMILGQVVAAALHSRLAAQCVCLQELPLQFVAYMRLAIAYTIGVARDVRRVHVTLTSARSPQDISYPTSSSCSQTGALSPHFPLPPQPLHRALPSRLPPPPLTPPATCSKRRPWPTTASSRRACNASARLARFSLLRDVA
jgi:hypothetical protein